MIFGDEPLIIEVVLSQPVTTQNSGYNQFPPAVNGWKIIHLVPDMAPSLRVEEEEPPT
jgi:hypothetical protein